MKHPTSSSSPASLILTRRCLSHGSTLICCDSHLQTGRVCNIEGCAKSKGRVEAKRYVPSKGCVWRREYVGPWLYLFISRLGFSPVPRQSCVDINETNVEVVHLVSVPLRGFCASFDGHGYCLTDSSKAHCGLPTPPSPDLRSCTMTSAESYSPAQHLCVTRLINWDHISGNWWDRNLATIFSSSL